MTTSAVSNDASSYRQGIDVLGEVSLSPTVERAVEAVRELLDMDVAYTTEHTDTEQHFRHMDGDGESFGIGEGMAMPLDQTYCQRVLDGRLPNLIPDVRGDDRAASLPVTEAADVGAFVSVPLVLSGGEIHGTLCAGSHEAKPSLGYKELRFLHLFARIVADQIEREMLAKKAEAAERTAHELELEAASALALISAVEARDSYTADHSKAVVGCAVEVARELGLDERDRTVVKHVALLHDIGKIAVPSEILNKPGALTDEEWEVMRRHPISSGEIIAEIPNLRHLAEMVRAEHERYDGTGYPDGLGGEDIPLASRITLVCDAYHAMTSDRPYRPALDGATARAEIEAGLGTQFCPAAGRALLRVVSR